MGSVYNRGTKHRPNWWGKYRDANGVWKSVPTNQPTKALARDCIEEREANIARGKPAIAEPKVEKTFKESGEYWLATYSPSLTSHKDNVHRMPQLMDVFGSMLLSDITAQKIDEFKAARQREKKNHSETGERVPRWRPATINRMLALLRKVLNDSVRWDFLKSAPKVRLLAEPESDFRYLQKDKAERLLSWAKENAPMEYPLYAMAIYTGARMGELYGLLWSSVDLSNGLVTFSRSYDQPFTKSKKVRRVPINKELSLVLKDWRRNCKGDLVFPANAAGNKRMKEKPPRHFAKHLASAGCQDINFHDLRHTAASLMMMAGMSMRTVQKMLGHSTIVVTERYSHLAPDFMAADADRMSLNVQHGLGHEP